jgi:hypothetical protein
LVAPFNVLLLELCDHGVVRFFFDTGVFFWREANVDLPENTGRNEYRLVEPPENPLLAGRRLTRSTIGPLPDRGQCLTLTFDESCVLCVHHHDDTTSVFLEGSASA